MTYEQPLTPTEQEIVEFLPATYNHLVNEFEFSDSTARDHISAIKRAGAPLTSRRISGGVKEFYMRDKENEHPTNQNDTRTYGTVNKKATKTKRLNKHANKVSNFLDEQLNNTEPAISDEPISKGGEEDVVWHVTDDHIGDKFTDEFDNVMFNTEIAIARIRERVSKGFEFIDRMENAGYDFHTAHYLMGGDIVTGAGIYSGQLWEVELNFNEQIEVAVEEHYKQIKRLSERFEAVQVVQQTGNHGEIRINGSSQEANADDIVYRMLDLLVRFDPNLDNVTVIRNHSTNFTNFEIRGHNAQVRHGQQMRDQTETRAGSDDFKSLLLQHDYPKLVYMGHYHFQSQKRFWESNIIRSGSIKPADDFEESIGKWSMPAATVHGVSDETPMTWKKDVEFA